MKRRAKPCSQTALVHEAWLRWLFRTQPRSDCRASSWPLTFPFHVMSQMGTTARQTHTQEIHPLCHGQGQSAADQIYQRALAFFAQSGQGSFALLTLICFF